MTLCFHPITLTDRNVEGAFAIINQQFAERNYRTILKYY